MFYTKKKNTGLYYPVNEHDSCGVGAVVKITGEPSHSIISMGNQILVNLQHRGAAGSDSQTGDGAGILFQIPNRFFNIQANNLGFSLPDSKCYGIAMIFGSKTDSNFDKCNKILEESVQYYGLKPIGWREVPVNSNCLGELALKSEPKIKQFFIHGNGFTDRELECLLYFARKKAEKQISKEFKAESEDYYITSMSCYTICYKGMFLAPQLEAYYTDLTDENTESSFAIVHQRYSTNTFPNWKLAQPFRMIAHNGEINTLSGNINTISSYEKNIKSNLLKHELSDLTPIIAPEQSDSACFDNVLELLVNGGRSLSHSMMMMIPEGFSSDYHVSIDKKAFYEYHSAIMEPWDGPAAIIFTDGEKIGGTLDRNGLRPCRYVVTNDDLVVMGSETGVIEFEPDQIAQKGRLMPGKMFIVDTIEKRIINDSEIKSKISRQKPYRRWLKENRLKLQGLYNPHTKSSSTEAEVKTKMSLFGYTKEELDLILVPMVKNSQEPIGSMGDDTPLAVLSEKPKLLYNYFKQLFAQVTNPSIDPYREGIVMSLMHYAGKKQNLLDETPKHCKQLKLEHPVLTNKDMKLLRHAPFDDFKIVTLNALFKANSEEPGKALEQGLQNLIENAEQAVNEGASLLILSDLENDENLAPIPSLLATGAVHFGLLEKHLRGETGIIIESGEPRNVMHFCLLCGYGADAVNPYLAIHILDYLQNHNEFKDNILREQVINNYITAIKKGLLKATSRLGISTLRSFIGAQTFEIVGLANEITEKYFKGTQSRIEGADLNAIAKEILARHTKTHKSNFDYERDLEYRGDYNFRIDGEYHGWNPENIISIRNSNKNDDNLTNNNRLTNLRSLFSFKHGVPVNLVDVEPESSIVKRFCTGAVSHGSISKETHEAMAIAMNKIGARSNTGEGGEDPQRYLKLKKDENKNSFIKQIASGRFGVTIEYLVNAKELQIKIAQGAKPGEGGQLPGQKVSMEIAKLRHSTQGVTLISPPPHHDIYSIEDIAQLIYDLKCSNPGVKVSVKLVSEFGVGTVAAGVVKANADEILISGYDGGTGASPLSSIKYVGGPWELGLAETHQTLVKNGLRDRVSLQVDGGLKSGRDVVIGAMLGAEKFGFGTSSLIALGCIMMRKCHEGLCPVGIATQDPALRKRFTGKPENLIKYMTKIAYEVRLILAELGFTNFEDIIGRSDLLQKADNITHYKAAGLDFTNLININNSYHKDENSGQPNTLEDHLDWKILDKINDSIESKTVIALQFRIKNIDRTIGTIISSKIVKKHGAKGLKDNTINLEFIGSAGQSFGAFLAPGLTLTINGDANDYLGKGLSGGRIIVKTPKSGFLAHENIVAGNTLLYGATSGEVLINGLVGERFAVRNSGATAVVEGVGDHGCEYMTGGTVVVLGRTGKNFAAGMSGGVAYVFDAGQLFDTLCNLDMVELEMVYKLEDINILKDLITKHLKWTDSILAKHILDNWKNMVHRFVKVIPIEYKKALLRLKEREISETDTTLTTEEVFYG